MSHLGGIDEIYDSHPGCHLGLRWLYVSCADPAKRECGARQNFYSTTIDWSGMEGSLAVLSGDPFKPGPFVIRTKMIDGFVIPPHWHPEDENITVIEGTFLMGMGDKVDKSAMREMPAGSFATMPKGMHHFVSCRGATVVQLHGMGPLV